MRDFNGLQRRIYGFLGIGGLGGDEWEVNRGSVFTWIIGVSGEDLRSGNRTFQPFGSDWICSVFHLDLRAKNGQNVKV